MPPSASAAADSYYRRVLRDLEGRDFAGACALPGAFYTDPGWLQVEIDELFRREWICVGRVDEVARPGDYFCYDHAGEPLLLVHGSDGEIRALANVCRHRGTVVASGSGNCKKFLCPYHHWAYDTAGRLLNAPGLESRADFDPGDCRLRQLACLAWQGFLFVNLDPAAHDFRPGLEPLQQRIGNYHLESMRLRYQADEVWDCNWKSLLENYMEGYHLTPLHRDTLHQVNPSRLCRHLPPGERHFAYSVGFSTRLPADRIGHPDLGEAEMDTCIMAAVPPAFAIGIGSDYSSFLCLQPLAPARVRVKMGLVFFGDSFSDADIDNAVRLFRETMDEDKQVLLRVQQGLASSHYQPGPLAAPQLEGTIWDFYQYLARRLGAG